MGLFPSIPCCGGRKSYETSRAVDALFKGGSRACGRFTARRVTGLEDPLFAKAVDVLARAFCGTEKTSPDPCFGWIYSGTTEGLVEPLPAAPSAERLAWFRWIMTLTANLGVGRRAIFVLVDASDVVVAAMIANATNSSPDPSKFEFGVEHWKLGPPPCAVDGRMRAQADQADVLYEKVKASVGVKDCLHIWVLGCDPECQGQGVGTAMLQLVADVADADGIHAYLEANGDKNEGFYSKKGGFNLMDRTVVQCDKAKPLDINGGISGMLRPPSALAKSS